MLLPLCFSFLVMNAAEAPDLDALGYQVAYQLMSVSDSIQAISRVLTDWLKHSNDTG